MNSVVARIGTGVVALALAATAPAIATGSAGTPTSGQSVHTITSLDGPRGVDALGRGRTLVTETGGDFSLVIERPGRAPRVVPLGNLPTEFPPAIALGRHGTVYLLTGASGPPPDEEARALRAAAGADGADASEPAEPAAGATLFKWRPGWSAPRPVADIAAYQETDPDPDDLEGAPGESNPFGLAALRDGTVLVADAAGNDLLRVWPSGRIRTVARLKTRTVAAPEGLPEGPPAGTPMESEAVATSVAVGGDGYWYVGELRGFPATPGTSQIWRIKPGSVGATCDPAHPRHGRCTRYADGLTSIIDLAGSRHGIYALELSKMSWLAFELGVPGAEVGGLFHVKRSARAPYVRMRELATGKLVLPGGVDVGGGVYVVGPLFGPGALVKIR